MKSSKRRAQTPLFDVKTLFLSENTLIYWLKHTTNRVKSPSKEGNLPLKGVKRVVFD